MLKANRFLGVIALFFFSITVNSAFAIDQTPTGFYYPTGTSQFSSGCGTWLGRDPANGGCYFNGYYHIGIDMMAAENSQIYAISDGVVAYPPSTGGWGAGNVGIVIKHKLSDGSEFLALYGHIKTTVNVGDSVMGGVEFAKIGYWSYGNHLHFGIHPGLTMPSTNWGMMPNSSWPDTNGFVDPINWIETKIPQCQDTIPLTGDWDGNGMDTTGTYDPQTAIFSLDVGTTVGFGVLCDLPITGDWDNDGDDDIGVVRPNDPDYPNTNSFYLDLNLTGNQHELGPYQFGNLGDIPIAGDWNGDGMDTIGVYQPNTSQFHLDNNNDGIADVVVPFGDSGDIPIVGDWDCDGDDDVGVFRVGSSTNTFHFDIGLIGGQAEYSYDYGNVGDLPIIGDWDADGDDNIGVYRPSTGQFFTNSSVPNICIICECSVSPLSQQVTCEGGSYCFGVSAGSNCSWTASPDCAWVAITSGGSGSGNKTVCYSVSQNNSISQRVCTITIQGNGFSCTHTVIQEGACSYSITPPSKSIPCDGGTGSVNVTAGSGCSWSASKNCDWVTLNKNSGSGSDTVSYTVTQNNSTTQRTCTITITGTSPCGSFTATHTITQAGACSYSITPPSKSIPWNGGTGSVNVTAGSGCSWSASKNCDWVTLNKNSGSGSDTVSYTVTQNNSTTQRTCTITITGTSPCGNFTDTHTIIQEGKPDECNCSISPTDKSFPCQGGSGSFGITVTNSNCSWSASKNCNWVTINGPSNGTGNGTVSYTVQENTGTSPRTCTITVTTGNNTCPHTVTQEGIVACKAKSITAAPKKLSLSKNGNGNVTITVKGNNNCLVEGTTVTATISGNGNQIIDVSPVSQATDANGQAVFAITAKGQKGTAVIRFRASGLRKSTTAKVKVR